MRIILTFLNRLQKIHILKLIGFCLLLGNLVIPLSAQAALLTCDSHHQIRAEFSNGSGWELCWSSTRRENIVLSEIHYKTENQLPFRVIGSMRLSQLHVTYDDSNVTYNDVTQFGLGGGYVSTLTASDCPEGELLSINERAGLCKQTGTEDAAYHSESHTEIKEVLTLFSISQVGSYTYLVTWKFYDDGSIEPSIGAAGALQRSSDHNHDKFGRELEGAPDKVWLSHTHNYYWRIDFDIGENVFDDVATEVSYPIDPAGKRSQMQERLTVETARKINPEQLTSWYITDDAENITEAPGYLIEPVNYGHKLVRLAQEPFTDFDFFVTRQNDCERFINENAKFNPDCGDDILQFTNNESLVNQDLIVWHRISFHHVPRNEDRQHMHSHWDGFVMQARNLSDKTPGHHGVTDNSTPFIQEIANQHHQIGDSITLAIKVSDADNDSLTFHSNGLPEGLTMSSEGIIQGELTKAGHYHATVQASDGFRTVSSHFNWEVKNSSTIGSGDESLLALLTVFLWYRRRRSQRLDCL